MVVQQVESLAEKGQASGQLRMSRYLIDCYLEALQNESAPTFLFGFSVLALLSSWSKVMREKT